MGRKCKEAYETISMRGRTTSFPSPKDQRFCWKELTIRSRWELRNGLSCPELFWARGALLPGLQARGSRPANCNHQCALKYFSLAKGIRPPRLF